jgi:hypothetical protein
MQGGEAQPKKLIKSVLGVLEPRVTPAHAFPTVIPELSGPEAADKMPRGLGNKIYWTDTVAHDPSNPGIV